MNIALIGYKGVGKTTIGKILSKKLQKKLMSTDDEIKKKTKLTVSEYVKRYGLNKFREIEATIIDEICNFDNYIIDAGGGIILRNENIVNIKKTGMVILLTADAKTIVSRVRGGKNKSEEIENVLMGGEKYNVAADYAIDTSSLSPEDVCEIIMHYINQEEME